MKTVATLIEIILDELHMPQQTDCTLYSLTGLQLTDDDLWFLQSQDHLYLETQNRPFDMRQQIDQYQMESLIGEGSFGKVYKAFHKKTKDIVAVKIIDISESFMLADKVKEIYKEASILQSLSHRNIIKIHNAFVIRKSLYLVMEYAGGGEVFDLVHQKAGLSELQAREIIKQVALAISVCHSYGVVHRDLKLENVLFETGTKIKVVDFGIAGVVQNQDKNTTATLKYMTPEMIVNCHSVADKPMDLWAIGVMAYTIVFNQFPFDSPNKKEIKDLILNKAINFPKPTTPEFQQFLHGCLNKNPAERITITDLLELPWFSWSDEMLEQAVALSKEVKVKKPVEEIKLAKINFAGSSKQLYPVRKQTQTPLNRGSSMRLAAHTTKPKDQPVSSYTFGDYISKIRPSSRHSGSVLK